MARKETVLRFSDGQSLHVGGDLDHIEVLHSLLQNMKTIPACTSEKRAVSAAISQLPWTCKAAPSGFVYMGYMRYEKSLGKEPVYKTELLSRWISSYSYRGGVSWNTTN